MYPHTSVTLLVKCAKGFIDNMFIFDLMDHIWNQCPLLYSFAQFSFVSRINPIVQALLNQPCNMTVKFCYMYIGMTS